jgi:hypothetical protein
MSEADYAKLDHHNANEHRKGSHDLAVPYGEAE